MGSVWCPPLLMVPETWRMMVVASCPLPPTLYSTSAPLHWMGSVVPQAASSLCPMGCAHLPCPQGWEKAAEVGEGRGRLRQEQQKSNGGGISAQTGSPKVAGSVFGVVGLDVACWLLVGQPCPKPCLSSVYPASS